MTWSYFLRRLLMFFLVIFTAASINFILPHLSGRDPIGETVRQKIAAPCTSSGTRTADGPLYGSMVRPGRTRRADARLP